MAIVQISRIQIRRGLQQDLPQLASAEMGWSLDSQRLFIGNGLTTEGAPAPGITEILTQNSNIITLLGLYTYQGASAGYTVVTGPDSSHPITRSFQSKLDDIANIRDFGAIGNGIADDTAAIQRALTQIYSPTYNDGIPLVRRTLFFPAGTYLTSSTIHIPPYTKIIGDGRSSTIITSANATAPILQTIDSQFNGTGATKPRDIFIQGLELTNTNTVSNITSSLMTLDGVVNAHISDVIFRGNAGSASNLVYVTDNVNYSRNITFESCSFEYSGSGVNIVVQGSGISAVRIQNSYFDHLSNVGFYASDSVNGLTTVANFYGNVGTAKAYGNTTPYVGLGGSSFAGNVLAGLTLGRQNIGAGNVIAIPTGNATTITTVSAGAGSFDYQLDNGSVYRFGVVKYTTTGSATTFEDDYTETGAGLGANLFIDSTGNLSCSTTTSAIFKYNLKQYF